MSNYPDNNYKFHLFVRQIIRKNLLPFRKQLKVIKMPYS